MVDRVLGNDDDLGTQLLRAFAQSAIRDYGIATRSAMTPVQTLSGGNAQKVVIARELFHAKGVLLANQPTRGLDIGVIEDIYTLLLAKRQEGFAILLASDELDEDGSPMIPPTPPST